MMRVDIANVVGTSVDEDGFQSTQWDAEGEELASPSPGQAHHAFGFWGRAPDAVVEPAIQGGAGSGGVDPSRAAQCLKLEEGGLTHLIDLQHVPTQAILPTLLPGESMQYSSAGNFIRVQTDGSVSISTTDAGGAPTGQAIAFRVRPTERVYFAPWGTETFDAYGYRIRHVGGARLTLGYMAGLPEPLSGGQSTARLAADVVEITGSGVAIGPTAAVRQAVAQALPLSIVLESIATALQAIQIAMATITTVSPGAAAAAASAPAVEAAVAAVSSALETISTQTAIG